MVSITQQLHGPTALCSARVGVPKSHRNRRVTPWGDIAAASLKCRPVGRVGAGKTVLGQPRCVWGRPGFQWRHRPNLGACRRRQNWARSAADTGTTPCTTASHICHRGSGRFSVVVPQQPAQAFAARDAAGPPAHLLPRCNQPVREPLVLALCLIVLRERDCGRLQRSPPEEDHPFQALCLDRTHESLEMRIQIRGARR